MAGQAVLREAQKDDDRGGFAYSVTKPVNLGQLRQSIADAHNHDNVQLFAQGDLEAASPQNPVTVWVQAFGDSDVSEQVVQQAIENHQADPLPRATAFDRQALITRLSDPDCTQTDVVDVLMQVIQAIPGPMPPAPLPPPLPASA